MKLLKVLSAAVLLTSLSACSVWEGWFEDEDDQKKELAEISPLFEASEVWERSVGNGVGDFFSRLAPVHAYEKLFIASRHGDVAAVDPVSGKELWSQSFVEWGEEGLLAGIKSLWSEGKAARLSGMAVAYQKLYVGSENGNLIALNAEDGSITWQQQLNGEIISAPYIDAGMVIVTTTSGKLIGVDAESGEEKWSFESDVPPLTLRGVSAPVASGGGAVFGTANGKISVVIMENGQLAWEQTVGAATGATELDRIVDVDNRPLIVGGILYAASYNGTLAALELRTGRILWKREYGSYRPISYDGNSLFIVDKDSNIYAVDRRNGIELWSQTGLSFRDVTGATPLGSFVVVADGEGYVHWLRQEDGEFVARKDVNSSGYYSAPVVLDRTVVVQGRDGDVTALNTP